MENNYDLSKLKKKKRINSKDKGGSFERSIAKVFNDRFGTLEFSRTPGSGAYATTHNLPEHLKIYGDLITPKNFKFCIECKKGYNKESLYSLFNPNSSVWKFIEQSEVDSLANDRPPLVIFKQDHQKTLAMTTEVFNGATFSVTLKGLNKEYNIYLLDELILAPDYFWFS